MPIIFKTKTKEKIDVLRKLDDFEKILSKFIELAFIEGPVCKEIVPVIENFIKLIDFSEKKDSTKKEDLIYQLMDKEINKRIELHARKFNREKAKQGKNFEILQRIYTGTDRLRRLFPKGPLSAEESKKLILTDRISGSEPHKELAYQAFDVFKSLGDYYKAKLEGTLFKENTSYYFPFYEVNNVKKKFDSGVGLIQGMAKMASKDEDSSDIPNKGEQIPISSGLMPLTKGACWISAR